MTPMTLLSLPTRLLSVLAARLPQDTAQAVDVVDHIAQAVTLDTAEWVRRGVIITAIWGSAWVTIWLIGVVARRILVSVDDGDDATLSFAEKRGATAAQLIKSVGRVGVVAVALLFTLNVFIDITPLLAGAGILGLAVSFGAQSLVKDVIAGFFILIENQFVVGDIIEVSGVSGVVEEMTMRMVVLRDVRGTVHIVPNGQIGVVSNKTRGWSRALVEVGVAYGADVDRAIEVFRDEARRMSEDPAWKDQLQAPLEVWGVETLGDSAVVIRTVGRTAPGAQFGLQREFNRRIKNRLDREGIEIPFPQRTLHVRVDDDRLLRILPQGGSSA